LPIGWGSGAEWHSWTYPAKHLPAEFHQSHAGFELFVKWLRSSPYRSSKLDPHGQSAFLLMCLGIGLVLRDLHTGQFELGEGDSDDHLPASTKHLKRSKLGWAQNQVLQRCCQEMWSDMQLCFNQDEHPQTPPRGRPKAKGPATRRKPTPPREHLTLTHTSSWNPVE
jgi:hypothetical protein